MRSRSATAMALAVALIGCSSHAGNVADSRPGGAASQGLDVRIRDASGIVGEVQTIHVDISRDGRPVTDAAATIAWDMDGMPMDRRATALSQESPGRYAEPRFVFSMPGRWRARVEVREKGHPHGVASIAIEATE